MDTLTFDEGCCITAHCCIESLHNLSLTSSNWKHNVEDYLQTKHIIEEKVDTRLFDWIMKYAVNLRMPPIFALGPKLSIEKAVQLFAKFDHLEICNLWWHDALFLLKIAFSDWVPCDRVLSLLVQSLRKRPTSCRIDADIFRGCNTPILYGSMSNLLECKCCTLRIYGKKESTNLSKVLNAFAYIDRLILSDGSLERVSSRLQIELQIEHATLINVSTDRCESRALLRLFAAVKHTFQMDKFPVCAKSSRLFKRFLRVEQSPKFVIMNNFPNALKSHLLDLGASIGGTSLPGETPLFVAMRTNFAFVVPAL
tara:strand:+ start:8714 stop:9646 length:933 start_codon:yes stop_codon:yes gene_type:complete